MSSDKTRSCVVATAIRFRHPPSIASTDAESHTIPRDDADLEIRYNTTEYDEMRHGTVTKTVTTEMVADGRKIREEGPQTARTTRIVLRPPGAPHERWADPCDYHHAGARCDRRHI